MEYYRNGFVLILVVMLQIGGVHSLNNRPIIGILAQETDKGDHHGDTYIDGNYVKYLEMAGARVVPIRVRQNHTYYAHIVNNINGVLFPGGNVNLDNSEYLKAGRILYDMATQANDAGDFFPIWGTCLGFEMLSVLTAGRNILVTCDKENMTLPLQLLPGSWSSRMFADIPGNILHALISWNVTANFHNYCLTSKIFLNTPELRQFFRPLSQNDDKTGKTTFLSTIEAFKYPFYGTQWHPEKNMYEWNFFKHLNHTSAAVLVGQYFANFFVNEARKNLHHYSNRQAESNSLMCNYLPVYLGLPTMKVQYYFNYSHRGSHRSHKGQLPHHISIAPTAGRNPLLYPGEVDQKHFDTDNPPEVSSCLGENHIFLIMGFGLLACLLVGIQLGRCLEAHTQTETWPDVLNWKITNSKVRNRWRRSPGTRRNSHSGQRVALLAQEKQYFTFEGGSASDTEV